MYEEALIQMQSATISTDVNKWRYVGLSARAKLD